MVPLLVRTTQMVCQPRMEVGELQLDKPRDYVEKVIPESCVVNVSIAHGAAVEIVRFVFEGAPVVPVG